jgi:hypothetical protein
MTNIFIEYRGCILEEAMVSTAVLCVAAHPEERSLMLIRY